MALIVAVTGELADPLDRDLLVDRLDFDELGWRGLWAYITCAPPGTALFHARTQGWSLGDKLSAEQLYETRKLLWRYTALHFEGGKDQPFPEHIDYPGAAITDKQKMALSWQTATVDQLISPEVRAKVFND